MKEQFEVIKVENETMTLKVNRSDTCQSCSANNSCGTGILANYFDHYSVFNRPSQDGTIVGDFITLEVPSSELFSRAFMLYILPLIMLFVGGYFGMLLFPSNELLQILLSFIGFLFAFVIVKYCYKNSQIS